MTINDGKGLYDKYGLIDSILSDMNSLRLEGVTNFSLVCDMYNRLNALKKGLREEEEDGNGDDKQGQDL